MSKLTRLSFEQPQRNLSPEKPEARQNVSMLKEQRKIRQEKKKRKSSQRKKKDQKNLVNRRRGGERVFRLAYSGCYKPEGRDRGRKEKEKSQLKNR